MATTEDDHAHNTRGHLNLLAGLSRANLNAASRKQSKKKDAAAHQQQHLLEIKEKEKERDRLKQIERDRVQATDAEHNREKNKKSLLASIRLAAPFSGKRTAPETEEQRLFQKIERDKEIAEKSCRNKDGSINKNNVKINLNVPQLGHGDDVRLYEMESVRSSRDPQDYGHGIEVEHEHEHENGGLSSKSAVTNGTNSGKHILYAHSDATTVANAFSNTMSTKATEPGEVSVSPAKPSESLSSKFNLFTKSDKSPLKPKIQPAEVDSTDPSTEPSARPRTSEPDDAEHDHETGMQQTHTTAQLGMANSRGRVLPAPGTNGTSSKPASNPVSARAHTTGSSRKRKEARRRDSDFSVRAFVNLDPEERKRILGAESWIAALLAAAEGLPIAFSLCSARKLHRGFPVLFVNKSFEKLTGYERTDVIGKNMKFLQCPFSEAAGIQQLSDALKNGNRCSVVLTNVTRDDKIFRNLIVVKPVYDDRRNYVYVMGVHVDVSREVDAYVSKTKIINDLVDLLPDLVYADIDDLGGDEGSCLPDFSGCIED